MDFNKVGLSDEGSKDSYRSSECVWSDSEVGRSIVFLLKVVGSEENWCD